MFDLAEEKQVRQRLADVMRFIVSQRLAPRIEGGRQLVMEIMGHNLRTKEAISLGEDEGRSFYDIIEASEPFGWVTFDRSILNAYEAGLVDEETALLFSTKKGKLQREIDLIKKSRGEGAQQSGLRMDLQAAGRY